MKALVYTFRTFPYQEKLKETFGEIFVFGKLKEDLDKFYEKIFFQKSRVIIGIALSKSGNFFEEKTINKFNGDKTITKEGKEELPLHIPQINQSTFKINRKTSDSFCNYTTYNIANFLLKNNIDAPLIFAHLNKNGIGELKEINFKQP